MRLRHEWSEPIGEAQPEDEEERIDIIHKGGRRQSIRMVLADHDRIGEVHRDDPQLTEDNGGTYAEELSESRGLLREVGA